MRAVVKSQAVMVDCLATTEYHYFRENLGSASGIHSLAIRQHMFCDLFKSLWKELEAWASKDDTPLQQSLMNMTKYRHEDSDSWLKHEVVNNAFALHQTHQEWRHEHMHMPRNCLGSGGTKSMIGVPDGLDIVMKMRESSNSLSALKNLHKARNVKLSNQEKTAPLSRHHHNEGSLDQKILLLTGQITREYFPEVQKKSFCPFKSKHPVRKP
jgi:tryptophan 2,3-dioxygenase